MELDYYKMEEKGYCFVTILDEILKEYKNNTNESEIERTLTIPILWGEIDENDNNKKLIKFLKENNLVSEKIEEEGCKPYYYLNNSIAIKLKLNLETVETIIT